MGQLTGPVRISFPNGIPKKFTVVGRTPLAASGYRGKSVKKSFPLHRLECNNSGPGIAPTKSGFRVGPKSMWIDKLAAGVVQVQTPIGPRYVIPSFWQRAYLLWMFRNFPILPHAVLSRRQQRLIDRMCSEQRFASMAYADGMDEVPVIGTIERRPPVEAESLPPRRPAARETSPLPAEVRQRP
jgi:hypothetical protein